MTEEQKFSEEYRSRLARELQELRTKGDRAGAREKLAAESRSPTGRYTLARALAREKETRLQFASRELDELMEEHYAHAYITSNEPSLYTAFPYVKNCAGVGIGVGVDQILDIMVNSNLEKVVLLDRNTGVSLVSRALLEVGRRHHELLGAYPASAEFVDYFRAARIPEVMEMVKGQFNRQELRILEKELRQEVTSGDTRLHAYLALKAEQKEFKSWVQHPEEVIRRYEKGDIIPVAGDLAGEKTMKSLGEQLEKGNTCVSLVYLSNAEKQVLRKSDANRYVENMNALPISDDTIFINTSMVSNIGYLPLPAYTASPTGRGLSFISWKMDIRTARDRMQQDALSEREGRIGMGTNIPEELGLVLPAPGLIVSRDIVLSMSRRGSK